MTEDPSLLEISKKIMNAFIKEYGSEHEFIKQEGRILTREETEKHFMNYIKDLNLEEYLTLNFTPNAVSQYFII